MWVHQLDMHAQVLGIIDKYSSQSNENTNTLCFYLVQDYFKSLIFSSAKEKKHQYKSLAEGNFLNDFYFSYGSMVGSSGDLLAVNPATASWQLLMPHFLDSLSRIFCLIMWSPERPKLLLCRMVLKLPLRHPRYVFFFLSAWELGKLYEGGCFTILWHIDTNLFDHIYFTHTYWVCLHCWGLEATWEYVVSLLNWLRHRLTGLFMWILAGFSLCWVYYAPFSWKKWIQCIRHR